MTPLSLLFSSFFALSPLYAALALPALVSSLSRILNPSTALLDDKREKLMRDVFMSTVEDGGVMERREATIFFSRSLT